MMRAGVQVNIDGSSTPRQDKTRGSRTWEMQLIPGLGRR